MRNLIQGIVNFRENLTDEKRNLFAQLALGQKPDALFIACSDSRVVPNLFASTNPGDLFVIRNVGNLIPPTDSYTQEDCVGAAIEFTLNSLEVSDIVICGHSECGAMHSILSNKEYDCCPHLNAWLKYGQKSLQQMQQGFTLDKELSPLNQLSQINVLQQIEHIKTYPAVIKRLKENQIRIHGWWFDIAHADVYGYEEELKKFIIIDKEESELILSRLFP